MSEATVLDGAGRFGARVDGDPTLRYAVGSRPGVWTATGDKAPVRLLGWCPEVTEHLVRVDDDGAVIEQRYTVRIGSGAPVTVTPEELRTGRAWEERVPGATGIGRRVVREALVNIVLQQATEIPQTYMVRRTGWHDLPDGTRAYLHPDGHTVPEGARVRVLGIRTDIAKAARQVEQKESHLSLPDALAAVAEHGWGPILGISVGARALAQSVVPVRCSLVPIGAPNTGKTLTAATALAVVMTCGWPPVVDGSFADTINSIEKKIGSAGDRIITLDDLSLTSDSGSAEIRAMSAKFDAVIRSFANDQAVRDRLGRDMELRESTYIRGIPVVTAQRLPPTVQASALRRIVLVRFEKGDNDYRWYAEHATSLDHALRVAGDAVLAALHRAGPLAEKWVESCDAEAARLLSPVVHRAIPDPPDGMDGVIKAAGQMLGGLLMLGSAARVDVRGLLAVLIEPFADALADQADGMHDRQTLDTGVREAVGSMLRAALTARRVHVRDGSSDLPADAVPGQTPQSQGLREEITGGVRTGGFGGEGASLYYLGERGLLGVTSADLHTLITQSRDPRLLGFTVRSLPAHLLREGVTLRSSQKGPQATERVRIGSGSRSTAHRLMLMAPDVVFAMPEPGEDELQDVTDVGPDQGPCDGRPVADFGPDGLMLKAEPAPCERCGIDTPYRRGGRPAHPGGWCTPVALPTLTVPALPEPAAPVKPVGRAAAVDQLHQDVPEQATVPALDRPVERVAARVPAARLAAVRESTGMVVTVTGGQIIPAGPGAARTLTEQEAESLPALLDRLGTYRGPVTAVLGDDAAAGYGITGKRPSLSKPWHRAFAGAVEQGWARPAHPADKPYVGPWTTVGKEDLRVSLVMARWLDAAEFPRGKDDPELVDAAGLAARLDRFASLTGWRYQTTSARTALDTVRRAIEGTAKRHPRWRPAGVEQWPVTADVPLLWERELTEQEAAMPHRYEYDAVKAYLSATTQAVISGNGLTRTGLQTFDRAVPGVWQIIVPEWPHALVPAPLMGAEPGTQTWLSTSLVALYEEAGISPEVTDSWTGERVQYAALRTWQEKVRDVLDRIEQQPEMTPDDRAVRAAVKGMYQQLHGKLRDANQGTIIRPDWGIAIRDAALANTLRKVYRAAGITEKAEQPRVPILVKHDAVHYVSDHTDGTADAPEGIVIGDRLGQFAVEEIEGEK